MEKKYKTKVGEFLDKFSYVESKLVNLGFFEKYLEINRLAKKEQDKKTLKEEEKFENKFVKKWFKRWNKKNAGHPTLVATVMDIEMDIIGRKYDGENYGREIRDNLVGFAIITEALRATQGDLGEMVEQIAKSSSLTKIYKILSSKTDSEGNNLFSSLTSKAVDVLTAYSYEIKTDSHEGADEKQSSLN